MKISDFKLILHDKVSDETIMTFIPEEAEMLEDGYIKLVGTRTAAKIKDGDLVCVLPNSERYVCKHISDNFAKFYDLSPFFLLRFAWGLSPDKTASYRIERFLGDTLVAITPDEEAEEEIYIVDKRALSKIRIN